jgi:hypothetical protein
MKFNEAKRPSWNRYSSDLQRLDPYIEEFFKYDPRSERAINVEEGEKAKAGYNLYRSMPAIKNSSSRRHEFSSQNNHSCWNR